MFMTSFSRRIAPAARPICKACDGGEVSETPGRYKMEIPAASQDNS
jgi:hypothetical protein